MGLTTHTPINPVGCAGRPTTESWTSSWRRIGFRMSGLSSRPAGFKLIAQRLAAALGLGSEWKGYGLSDMLTAGVETGNVIGGGGIPMVRNELGVGLVIGAVMAFVLALVWGQHVVHLAGAW